MVTCHSIAHVQDRFIGDPLDIEMFVATNWTLSEETGQNKQGLIELDNFYPAGKIIRKSKISFNLLNAILF